MKVIIKGNCLGGGFEKVNISQSNKLVLRKYNNSRAPIEIPLHVHNITVKNHLVSIGKYHKVNVVEHLFSALYGLNFFNVCIDFFGDEVPFFDGSSQIFVESLSQIKEQSSYDTLKLNKKITVKEGNSFIQYEPFQEDNLFVEMELSHPHITTQKIALAINRRNYIEEIAPARTFVFTDKDDPRLKKLPPYGIGVTKTRMYSATPIRFSDELVRHKILDLLGDLYVIQHRLAGKITGKNTSHKLNFKFVRKLTQSILD